MIGMAQTVVDRPMLPVETNDIVVEGQAFDQDYDFVSDDSLHKFVGQSVSFDDLWYEPANLVVLV